MLKVLWISLLHSLRVDLAFVVDHTKALSIIPGEECTSCYPYSLLYVATVTPSQMSPTANATATCYSVYSELINGQR